jgi:hypothetical protein
MRDAQWYIWSRGQRTEHAPRTTPFNPRLTYHVSRFILRLLIGFSIALNPVNISRCPSYLKSKYWCGIWSRS